MACSQPISLATSTVQLLMSPQALCHFSLLLSYYSRWSLLVPTVAKRIHIRMVKFGILKPVLNPLMHKFSWKFHTFIFGSFGRIGSSQVLSENFTKSVIKLGLKRVQVTNVKHPISVPSGSHPEKSNQGYRINHSASSGFHNQDTGSVKSTKSINSFPHFNVLCVVNSLG
jgi:hypothetical protein